MIVPDPREVGAGAGTGPGTRILSTPNGPTSSYRGSNKSALLDRRCTRNLLLITYDAKRSLFKNLAYIIGRETVSNRDV